MNKRFYLRLTKGSAKKERLPKTIIIKVCAVQVIHPKANPDSFVTPNVASIKATEKGYIPIPPLEAEIAKPPITKEGNNAFRPSVDVSGTVHFTT